MQPPQAPQPTTMLEALPSVLEEDEENRERDWDDEVSPSCPSSSVFGQREHFVVQRFTPTLCSLSRDVEGWSSPRADEFNCSSSTSSSSSFSTAATSNDSSEMKNFGGHENAAQDYKQFMNTEYSKYFLMLKAGVPKQWVVKACEVDGRDTAVLDNPQILLLSTLTAETDTLEHDDNEGDNESYRIQDPQDLMLSSELVETAEDFGKGDSESRIHNSSNFEDPDPSLKASETGGSAYQGSDSWKKEGQSKDIEWDFVVKANQPTNQDSLRSDLGQPIDGSRLSSEHPDGDADKDNRELEQKTLPLSYRKYVSMLRTGTAFDRVSLLVELDGKDPAVLLDYFDDTDLDPELRCVTNAATCRCPIILKIEESTAIAPEDKNKTGTECKAEDSKMPMGKAEAVQQAVTTVPRAKFKRSEYEDPEVPLAKDPRFARYFLMVKARVPMDRVRRVVEMDGKDPGVLDLDPERSYASQRVEVIEQDLQNQQIYSNYEMDDGTKHGRGESGSSQVHATDVTVADDVVQHGREEMKSSKITTLLVGRQSTPAPPADKHLFRGRSIECNGERKTSDSLKVNVAVLQGEMKRVTTGKALDANITNLSCRVKDHQRVDNLEDDAVGTKESCTTGYVMCSRPQLKDDPEYQKYYKMLKMGLPIGAAKQAMSKDGKDTTILDLDPDKPLNLQKTDEAHTSKSPLKDSPEYQRYFKMLKIGLPLGAAKQAMAKDGKDCTILDLDPNKALVDQRPEAILSVQIANRFKSNKPTVVRKRLFWNSIEQSNLQGSLWERGHSDGSLDLNGLEYDKEEFDSLFTLVKKKEKLEKEKITGRASLKSNSNKQRQQKKSIQLIDSRRQMNGSILLAKYKHDYNVLARKVNKMDPSGMCDTELLALMQLLPSKDESLAIRAYLPTDDGFAKDAAITMLGECEKYMVSMLNVEKASDKLKCMIYQTQFQDMAHSLAADLESLRAALTCVRKSDRLTRLMLFALRLGNTMNTGGSGKDVTAITLDSLLKLQEAKAFDKKTSVLHYLVKLIAKNDKDVLNVSQDLVPALKVERITLDSLAKSLGDLQEGFAFIKIMTASGDGLAMNSFVVQVDLRLKHLAEDFKKCKQMSLDVLKYFGEDQSKPLNEFFNILARFIAMFESARAEISRLEEAKARKERIRKPFLKGSSLGTAAGQDRTNLASSRSAVLHEILKRGPTI